MIENSFVVNQKYNNKRVYLNNTLKESLIFVKKVIFERIIEYSC